MIANHHKNGFIEVFKLESELQCIDSFAVQVYDVKHGSVDEDLNLDPWIVIEGKSDCNKD